MSPRPGLTDQQVLTAELSAWPAPGPSAAVVRGDGEPTVVGPGHAQAWASVTKLLTALTVLDCARRGELTLDEPAGPPGSTVRHLLAHASGLSAESDRVLSPPGRRRIYSNAGFEVLGELVTARTGGMFDAVLRERLLAPLHMVSTTCPGSPAHGARGPAADLARLARELLRPQHLPRELVADATTVAYPGLAGVLPGFGRQEPNDWGLGFEVRGSKDPHWTSPLNSPATFGHFGQAGAFLWVDPMADMAVVATSDTPFGPWAAESWPRLATHLLGGPVPQNRDRREDE